MLKLVVIVVLLGFAVADVREILRHSHGRFAVKSARYDSHPRSNDHNLRSPHQTDSEENRQFKTIFVEDPVSHQVQAFDVVESDEPAAVAFQLQSSHADYQGPYHYEQPKLDNGYLAPIVTTHGPNDAYPGFAPIITTHKPNDEYPGLAPKITTFKPNGEYPGLAPIITTHKPNDEYPGLAPIITTHKPNGDYLPPHLPRDAADIVAK